MWLSFVCVGLLAFLMYFSRYVCMYRCVSMSPVLCACVCVSVYPVTCLYGLQLQGQTSFTVSVGTQWDAYRIGLVPGWL